MIRTDWVPTKTAWDPEQETIKWDPKHETNTDNWWDPKQILENSLVSLKQYGTQLKYYKIPNWKLLNGTQKLKVLRTQDGTLSNYFPVN